jgi:hypothetical protein
MNFTSNYPHIPEIPNRLLMRFAERRVALFIGAGVSMSAAAPGWDKLVQSLFRSFRADDRELKEIEGFSLEQKVSYFVNQYGRHELNEALSSDLDQHRDLTIHKTLLALPISIVLTTNYDPHLQEAAELIGRDCHVIRSDSEIPLLFGTRELTIIHLYGDLENPLATEEDLINFERHHPGRSLLLQHVLLTHTVLFLGFSFRDYNLLNHVLRTHDIVRRAPPDNGTKPTHYAYMLDPNPPKMVELWPSRGVQILSTLFTKRQKQNPRALPDTFTKFVNELVEQAGAFSYKQINREEMIKREESNFLEDCVMHSRTPVMRHESTYSVLALPDRFSVKLVPSKEGHRIGIERREIYRKWLSRKGKILLLLNCNRLHLRARKDTLPKALQRLQAIKLVIEEQIDNENLIIGIRRHSDAKGGFASLGNAVLLQSDPPGTDGYKNTRIIRDRRAVEIFNKCFDRELDSIIRYATGNFENDLDIRLLNEINIKFIQTLLDKIESDGAV